MKWYNVELNEWDAVKLKDFLYGLDAKFETSGCFEKVHFEILLDKDSNEFKEIENFLNDLSI